MLLHQSRFAKPIAGQDLPRLVGVERARTPRDGFPEIFNGSSQADKKIRNRHDPGYSPITDQRKPIMMKKPEKSAIRPIPP